MRGPRCVIAYQRYAASLRGRLSSKVIRERECLCSPWFDSLTVEYSASSAPTSDASGRARSVTPLARQRVRQSGACRRARALGDMRLSVTALAALVSSGALAGQALPVAVSSVSQLPPVVARALQELCKGCRFSDVGAPWQATDVLIGDFPTRRLIQATQIGTSWAIRYEHGGRGRHEHAVTIEVHGDRAVVKASDCQSPEPQLCEW